MIPSNVYQVCTWYGLIYSTTQCYNSSAIRSTIGCRGAIDFWQRAHGGVQPNLSTITMAVVIYPWLERRRSWDRTTSGNCEHRHWRTGNGYEYEALIGNGRWPDARRPAGSAARTMRWLEHTLRLPHLITAPSHHVCHLYNHLGWKITRPIGQM